MNNKAFSTIELLVSFIIISFIAIGMFKTVLDLSDKMENHQELSKITILNGNIINSVQKDLVQKKFYSIDACGVDCYYISYQDWSTKQLKIDSTANTIQYGGIKEKLPQDVVITGNLQVTKQTFTTDVDDNDTILKIYIPMQNEVDNRNEDIRIVYQYDSRGLVNVYTNSTVTNLTSTSVTVTGGVTSDGGKQIIERGVAYGTSTNPLVTGTKVVVSGTIGSFSADLSSLIPDTPYFARAYITNSEGTTYGEEITFSTLFGGIDQYTVLMLHMDGTDNGTTFTDETGKTVTRNGDTITKTEIKKFGTSSGYFDGTDDYLSISDSNDWNFGTGEFTIDFWAYQLSGDDQRYITQYDDSENYWQFYYNDGNIIGLEPSVGGGGLSITEPTYGLNQWNHFAIVGTATETILFINGVEKDRETRTASFPNPTNPLRIASFVDYNSDYDYQGYFDEFRISKGIARWTTNFTLPTGPYTE